MCGETSSRPLFKKSNPRISLDQQTKTFYSLFLLYARVEDYQKILNLRC